MWFTYVACMFLFFCLKKKKNTLWLIFASSISYFVLSAPQCGSRWRDLMQWLIYASQDKLQIGNVQKNCTLNAKEQDWQQTRPEQRRDDPPLQAHAQTHMSMHRCTETHTNRERAAPSAPALTRANTDSIETVLLSVGNIISCSGLKAPYGEMFFYGVDVSDGSLGGARSSWIDPYSDASCTPPPSYTHTHTCTHQAGQSRCLWKSKDMESLADCRILFIITLCLFIYIYLFIEYFILCFFSKLMFTLFSFLWLSSLYFFQELACVLMPTTKWGNCKISSVLVNEMHIFFVSSTHLT